MSNNCKLSENLTPEGFQTHYDLLLLFLKIYFEFRCHSSIIFWADRESCRITIVFVVLPFNQMNIVNVMQRLIKSSRCTLMQWIHTSELWFALNEAWTKLHMASVRRTHDDDFGQSKSALRQIWFAQGRILTDFVLLNRIAAIFSLLRHSLTCATLVFSSAF